MINRIENSDEILDSFVKGFHIYSLDYPVHVIYAGSNLKELLGVAKDELLSEDKDGYLNFIHPDDRKKYQEKLENIKNTEGSYNLQYRIINSDGSTFHISDDFTVKRNDDGKWEGYSVLCDITKLKNERNDLQIINSALPFGFIKYTCEKHPKVTYINKQMLDIMKFPEVKDGEMDYFQLYRENIYLMIPIEERSRLAYCLGKISSEDAPFAGELTVTCCDGKKARLFGWVSKHVNEEGSEEFVSVCMDITERYKRQKEKETRNYIRALTDVYDKIFEYDYSSNTVRCLHWQNSDSFKWMMDVPMQMEDATEKWIETTVFDEDKKEVSLYFKEFHDENLIKSDPRPRTINYREVLPDGKLSMHTGIFLKIDSTTGLFCCRSTEDSSDTENLRSENESLKNMQEMVMKFSEGLSAFQVKDQLVTPLYVSDNVLEFFGFSKEEWMPMMKKAVPIKKLVSRCEVEYKDFMKLLSQGEAEYTYYDINLKKKRHIKAITSSKSTDTSSPFYVMLYNLDEKGSMTAAPQKASKVYVRTFGYFDVFVDDKPIAFRNEKSKELLALLIDRKGGFVTSEEAISFLWEETTADSAALARYRKVALKLKNILEEYGISYIVESVNGKRRIDTKEIRCDLYDFMSGKDEYKMLFKGSYLTNYSWGETTLAELLKSTL